jgi:hypothetical protein
MKPSDLKINDKYECVVGQRIVPVSIVDNGDSGVIALNLDTNREVAIKAKDLKKRFKAQIVSLSEWRLKNGD